MRLIYREGTSSKFWEARIEGNKLITRYGRIGQTGREESMGYSSPEAAEAEMNKLIKQKLNMGYVEERTSSGSTSTSEGSGLVEQSAPQYFSILAYVSLLIATGFFFFSGSLPSTLSQCSSSVIRPLDRLNSAQLSKLQSSLDGLENAVGLLRPDERPLFNPPASVEQLKHLSLLLKDQPLPEELRVWFGWHSGQESGGVIIPGENRRLISLDESIKAWRFFADPEEEYEKPWCSSWIPIMENGSGDYVVYETKGSKIGQLINYYHDDQSRPTESKSLTLWVDKASKEIKRYAKNPPESPAGFDLSRLQKRPLLSGRVFEK
jgi:predicted DNA-binding WGR domain protein/cell wall assembly regulator SMI1